MKVLGIDIGGSGVKGAVVDTRTGKLVSDRYRLKTPDPATPQEVASVVSKVVTHFKWHGPVGCGMPGPIKDGHIMVVSNLDKSWAGVRAHELFARESGCAVTVINDADAAGLAEMKFGAGRGQKGVVVLTTLGTGIGSAVFVDGVLLPNTELGHIEVRGKIAEERASARIRKSKNLSWEKWGRRLSEYYAALEFLLWPDLIIVGGGVSRKSSKFLPFLSTRAKVVPARMHNEAGIIGAALAAVPPRRGTRGSKLRPGAVT
jgi:polyphosphate glucokinase